MKRRFAVVILLEVTDDSIKHEDLYDMVPRDNWPEGVREVYFDVDPEPGHRLSAEELNSE